MSGLAALDTIDDAAVDADSENYGADEADLLRRLRGLADGVASAIRGHACV